MAYAYNAVSDVKETLEMAKDNRYILVNNQDTIETNEKLYFVGRTQEYVFLFNALHNSNTYIPMNEIKRIIRKTKPQCK